MKTYFIHCNDKVWGYERTLGFFTMEPYRKSCWVARGDSEMHHYGSLAEALSVARTINPKGLPCISVGCAQVDL